MCVCDRVHYKMHTRPAGKAAMKKMLNDGDNEVVSKADSHLLISAAFLSLTFLEQVTLALRVSC